MTLEHNALDRPWVLLKYSRIRSSSDAYALHGLFDSIRFEDAISVQSFNHFVVRCAMTAPGHGNSTLWNHGSSAVKVRRVEGRRASPRGFDGKRQVDDRLRCQAS
jgi:hypothetical protein